MEGGELNSPSLLNPTQQVEVNRMEVSNFASNLKNTFSIIKMEAIRSEHSEEQKIELEDQIILRLPQPQAEAVKTAIKQLKSKKFKKFLTITLDNDRKDVRTGTVKVKKQVLHAKLVDLPCIIDSCKTTNKAHLFKTAGISQMLICQKEKFPPVDETAVDTKNDNGQAKNKVHAYPHGITPPLKNVRKHRFRKILKNKEDLEEVAEIEKEVFLLLRADNEAVSTRFEIHYPVSNQSAVNECAIFGEVISDSDSDQESPMSSGKSSTIELHENAECPN